MYDEEPTILPSKRRSQAASSGKGKKSLSRVSSFGRTIKTNSRLDDLEERKLSARKLRKLREEKEKKERQLKKRKRPQKAEEEDKNDKKQRLHTRKAAAEEETSLVPKEQGKKKSKGKGSPKRSEAEQQNNSEELEDASEQADLDQLVIDDAETDEELISEEAAMEAGKVAEADMEDTPHSGSTAEKKGSKQKKGGSPQDDVPVGEDSEGERETGETIAAKGREVEDEEEVIEASSDWSHTNGRSTHETPVSQTRTAASSLGAELSALCAGMTNGHSYHPNNTAIQKEQHAAPPNKSDHDFVATGVKGTCGEPDKEEQALEPETAVPRKAVKQDAAEQSAMDVILLLDEAVPYRDGIEHRGAQQLRASETPRDTQPAMASLVGQEEGDAPTESKNDMTVEEEKPETQEPETQRADSVVQEAEEEHEGSERSDEAAQAEDPSAGQEMATDEAAAERKAEEREEKGQEQAEDEEATAESVSDESAMVDENVNEEDSMDTETGPLLPAAVLFSITRDDEESSSLPSLAPGEEEKQAEQHDAADATGKQNGDKKKAEGTPEKTVLQPAVSSSPETTSPSASEAAAAAQKKGRDTYYCKHCDTTFPVGFFRNVQQFGAHCSNCSRGRSLTTPDDSYASRLPTRMQRALRRKKRMEEGAPAPRKRARSGKKKKGSRPPQPKPQPRERLPREKKKPKVANTDSSESDEKLRYKKRHKSAPYDGYSHHGERRMNGHTVKKRKHWGGYDAARRRLHALSHRPKQKTITSAQRVDELPQNLLLRIFSFLDKGMSCKLFGRIYNHDSLWKRLFCKQWREGIGYAFTGSWKQRYRARLQYIKNRKRPENLPSLLQNHNAAGLDAQPAAVVGELNDSKGAVKSSPPLAKSTPVPSHGHWLAEKIMDSQPKIDPISGKSHMEYLIKWEGFGDEWNSWLNEDDVWCKELIEEYNNGGITVPPSAQASRSKKRRLDGLIGENGHADPDGYSEEERLPPPMNFAATNGTHGGKGNLFRYPNGSTGRAEGEDDVDLLGPLWDLDMDEDLWRDTWDTEPASLMSEDDDDEEEEYEDVPMTKEEREQQQMEFLKALEANANYKPVILFFEKS